MVVVIFRGGPAVVVVSVVGPGSGVSIVGPGVGVELAGRLPKRERARTRSGETEGESMRADQVDKPARVGYDISHLVFCRDGVFRHGGVLCHGIGTDWIDGSRYARRGRQGDCKAKHDKELRRR